MASSNTASFYLDLEDNTSGAAESAASALDKLHSAINRDTKALAQLSKAQRNLKAAGQVETEAYRKLTEAISKKKTAIGESQRALIDLGGTYAATRGPVKRASTGFGDFTKQAQGLGGPLGQVSSRLSSITSLVGSGSALTLGLVAMAAAFAAVAVAAGLALAKVLKYGLAAADAGRSELLLLEGLTKRRNWYGIAAGSATELQGAIDRVSGAVAIGRSDVLGYAQSLYRAGLRGGQLEDALEAVSIKAATQGSEAAKSFQGWVTGTALAGRSIKGLTNDVRARLGGIAKAQLLSLDVQAKKLRESFDLIFSGIEIDRLLSPLGKITSLFSQATVTGKALKALATVLFAPLVRVVEWLGPHVEAFFQGAVILALDFAIMVLKAATWIRDAFGIKSLKGLDMTRTALLYGKIAAGLFITVIGLLGVAMTALATPFITTALAIEGVIRVFEYLWDLFSKADFSGIGTAIVEGLLGALIPGGALIKKAVEGLASTAMDTFKGALGIHSPSKAFMHLGVQLPRGIEAGIEAGQPSLDGTVSGMVPSPSTSDGALVPMPSAAPATKVSSSSSRTVTIGSITIQTDGTTAKSIVGDLRSALEDILSNLVTETGAPEVPV